MVPNPSFEDTVYCPFGLNNPDAANQWFNPTQASPDYYNACANNGGGVPLNDFGYQHAQDGNAYIGIATYSGIISLPEYREYMSIKLNDKLQPGVDYFWCMYISYIDSVNFASNNVGIGLSLDSITDFASESLLNIPVYGNHSAIINDNIGWTKIGGSFVAEGDEKFLYIGNFYDDAHTDVVQLQFNAIGDSVAYYYIDNVYLGTTPCMTSSISVPNVFTPNGDGVNDLFYTQDIGIKEKNMIVYNRWGAKVYESSDHNTAWDGMCAGKECSTGIYFYTLDYFNVELQKTIQKKGFIHLLR